MKISYKIHITSLIFYTILILSGYINYLFNYLIIILIHELGHIITLKLLKININSITIYPFGGIINTDVTYNLESNKLLLISISGILFQIICLVIFNGYTSDIFIELNINLIIFNLLPIYPSDGSKIMTSILERFISYRRVLIISNITSFIILFLLFIYSKNILIFILLYVMNIKIVMLFNYIYNKFILERYLYKRKYKKDVYIKNINHIKKCRNNFIKCDNIYMEEGRYLNRKFGEIY